MAHPLRDDDVVGETPDALLVGAPQGSVRWHELREGAVGGSLISALVGGSRFLSRDEAVAEMVRPTRATVTIPMIRGLVAEKPVRDAVARARGVQIDTIGMAVSKSNSSMRASPDGVYSVPGGGVGIVEIKVVSSRVRAGALRQHWTETGAGKRSGWVMPEEHVHQIHYTAGVLGAAEILYCVVPWEGDCPICVWKIPHDRDLYNRVHVPAARSAVAEAAAIRNQ